MVKFSLLICVYDKECPLHLKRCLESINSLLLGPDEVVVVKDGPLTAELDEVLEGFRFSEGLAVNFIALPENVTLGPARAAGVLAAVHEWVAIMDSDDICRPDRFARQLDLIGRNPELGLVGGQIAEFSGVYDGDTEAAGDSGGLRAATRVVPTGHDDIVRYAKFRSPFNHMTVMFKRDEVLKAGNYRRFPLFEDYDLWTRMIKNGTICANHPDVLVDARIDSSTFGRRRGVSYIRSEWRMQKQLKALGFINNAEFVRNLFLRIPVRLLPGKVLGGVYKGFARKRN